MSIIICDKCDKRVDTDFEEMYDIKETGEYIIICYSCDKKIDSDYEMICIHCKEKGEEK